MLLYQICTHCCLKINTINLVFELALEYQMQNQLSKTNQQTQNIHSVNYLTKVPNEEDTKNSYQFDQGRYSNISRANTQDGEINPR